MEGDRKRTIEVKDFSMAFQAMVAFTFAWGGFFELLIEKLIEASHSPTDM